MKELIIILAIILTLLIIFQFYTCQENFQTSVQQRSVVREFLRNLYRGDDGNLYIRDRVIPSILIGRLNAAPVSSTSTPTTSSTTAAGSTASPTVGSTTTTSSISTTTTTVAPTTTTTTTTLSPTTTTPTPPTYTQYKTHALEHLIRAPTSYMISYNTQSQNYNPTHNSSDGLNFNNWAIRSFDTIPTQVVSGSATIRGYLSQQDPQRSRNIEFIAHQNDSICTQIAASGARAGSILVESTAKFSIPSYSTSSLNTTYLRFHWQGFMSFSGGGSASPYKAVYKLINVRNLGLEFVRQDPTKPWFLEFQSCSTIHFTAAAPNLQRFIKSKIVIFPKKPDGSFYTLQDSIDSYYSDNTSTPATTTTTPATTTTTLSPTTTPAQQQPDSRRGIDAIGSRTRNFFSSGGGLF
jgi:hypothetical protein